MKNKVLFPIVVIASMLALWCVLGATNTVKVVWDPPVVSNDVLGYYFYQGVKSSNYPTKVDVGSNRQYQVTGLAIGSTNFFSASAYSSARIEGPLAGELKYVVPGYIYILPSPASNGTHIVFATDPGKVYNLEANLSLINSNGWTNIWSLMSSAAGMAEYYDTNNKAPAKYYRLLIK